MRLDNVFVQLNAEAGLVRQLDMSVLNDRPIVEDDIVHPIAFSDHRLASEVVANGRRPLHGRHRANHAAGIVVAQRQEEQVAQVSDFFRLEQPPGDAPNGDEITRILMTAPEADEPFTPEEEDSLERAREEARRGETKPWPEVRIDSRKWDEDIVRDFAPNADGAKWLKEVDDEIDRGDFSPIG